MQRYAKAIIALLGALATWGITAAEDEVYSQVELWGALLACVTAFGVWAWPNKPPAGHARRPDQSEQAGHADVSLIVGLLIAAVLLVLLLKLLGVDL